MQHWKPSFTEYSWFAEFLIKRNKILTTDMSLSNLIAKCVLWLNMIFSDGAFMREELHVQLYEIFLKRKFFQLSSFSCKV